MSTYSQILKRDDQGRRQLWYIAGPEKALVQDALELAKAHVSSGVDDVYQTVFIGGEVSAHEIRQRLLETGHFGRSLVLLLDADKFKHWDKIGQVLKQLPRTDFFIAVSNEDYPDERQPHIALFRGSSKVRYVVCKPFTVDESIEWLRNRLHIGKDASRYLITRSRGDTEWLLNAVRKLETIKGYISLEVAELMVKGVGTADFADSLLNYRKRDAILSLYKDIPIAGMIGTLAESVRKASQVGEGIRSIGYFSRALMRERTRMPDKVLNEYRPLSRLYDRSNTARCMQAILRSHEQLVHGERGAWLALIARW